jgi:hypothetical protein
MYGALAIIPEPECPEGSGFTSKSPSAPLGPGLAGQFGEILSMSAGQAS